MSWDPGQYLAFGDLRLRPALDLMARIPAEAPKRIVDLGCGAGNVTKVLAARWPGAEITGIDGSAAMLERARTAVPGVTWMEADFAAWRPEPPGVKIDLIYSNAALHWTKDHATLFPALFSHLAPGGVLAVQMPRQFEAPSHTLMRTAAEAGPWWKVLEPLFAPPPVAGPEFYYDLLAGFAAHLDIWESEFMQVLEGPDPVAEWTKGTWLRPLLEALDEPDRSAFEQTYREMVREVYPARADGRTLFPFRRLFLIAQRS